MQKLLSTAFFLLVPLLLFATGARESSAASRPSEPEETATTYENYHWSTPAEYALSLIHI